MSTKAESAYASRTDRIEVPAATLKRPRGGTFRALAEPNYRKYLAGSFVSNIGTWMQRVAQDWLVLELSGGSGLAVGITTGLQFLPMLLLSPYGGLIADRFNKQKILKLTQAWLALCAAALGVLAVAGVARTAHVYAIAFAFGLGTAKASYRRWLAGTTSRTPSGSIRPPSTPPALSARHWQAL
jgi:MFS family permease